MKENKNIDFSWTPLANNMSVLGYSGYRYEKINGAV